MEIILICLLGFFVLPASNSHAQIVGPVGGASGAYVMKSGDTMSGDLVVANGRVQIGGSQSGVVGSLSNIGLSNITDASLSYSGATFLKNTSTITDSVDLQVVGDGTNKNAYLNIYADASKENIQARNAGTGAAVSLNLNPKGGNVGIGDTAPQAKLTVNGNIHSSGTITTSGNLGVGTSAPATTLGVAGAVQISSSAAIAPSMATGIREGLHFTHTVSDGVSRITGSYGAANGKLQVVSDNVDFYTGAGVMTINLPAAGATTGGALCLNASKVLTKCTSAVDASGNCTCP